jgi:ATP-dependent phosphoenolpyruvate carboxykinase
MLPCPTTIPFSELTIAQIANPSVAALYEDALVYETGSAITSSGALSAYSGEKTGRSPSDKRIVEEDSSKDNVWWGPVNKPMKPDVSIQSSAYPSRTLMEVRNKMARETRPQTSCALGT